MRKGSFRIPTKALQNKAQLCCGMLDRPWGRCLKTCLQTGFKILETKGLLFDGQRSTMAGKVCLFVCVLVECDNRWGNCLIAVL